MKKFMLMSFISFACLAYSEPTVSAVNLNQTATAAIYPNEILDTNYSDSKVKISFDVLFQSKNNMYLSDLVKIANSSDLSVTNLSTEVRNGSYFLLQHYIASIDQNYDLKNYPFDTQSFSITLEAPESLHLTSYFSTKDKEYQPDFELDTWKYVKYDISENTTSYSHALKSGEYKTNSHQQISYSYEFKHQDWRTYINLFAAFFICAVFALFGIFSSDFDTKFQLFIAAIFGFIGNKYIVDSMIPTSVGLSLYDYIQIVTFALIVFSAVHIFIEKLLSEEKQSIMRKISGIASTIIYFGLISYYTINAILS